MSHYDGGSNDSGTRRGTKLRAPSRTRTEDSLRPPAALVHAAMFTAVVILSAGIVLALLLFIYLSFQNPNSATVLIPAIFGPIGAVVVVYAKKLAEKYLERYASEPGEDPGADPDESPGKLVERLGELATDRKRIEDKESRQSLEPVRSSSDGSSGDVPHVPPNQ